MNWGGSQSQSGSFGEEKYHCPYHILYPDPSTFFMAIISSFSTSVPYSRPQLLQNHNFFSINWGQQSFFDCRENLNTSAAK
jgi:hypothetical protein